jgi:hypothetical protein
MIEKETFWVSVQLIYAKIHFPGSETSKVLPGFNWSDPVNSSNVITGVPNKHLGIELKGSIFRRYHFKLVFNEVIVFSRYLPKVFVDGTDDRRLRSCDSNCVVSLISIDDCSTPSLNQKLLNCTQVFGLGEAHTVSFVVRKEAVSKVSSAADKDSIFSSLSSISDTVEYIIGPPFGDVIFFSSIRFSLSGHTGSSASVADNVSIN